MAVDYWHRLVIHGPHETVDRFRLQLRRTVSRSEANQSWRETVPFSFQQRYDLAPAATRIHTTIPWDPFDISVWPLRRLPEELAEVRYQFHTRSLEMWPFVRLLSRKFPTLIFRLVTHCLDDGEVESYRIVSGRLRNWIVPERIEDVSWEHASQKFDLVGDDLYESDEATFFAEEAIREAALDHWSDDPGPPRCGPRKWWNRPVLRDFRTEQAFAIAEFSRTQNATSDLRGRSPD